MELKFLKTDFAKNVLTLFTGTSIAQGLAVAITPILSRLYTPDDFGIFTAYVSLASIISVAATGRYETAVMLPDKEEDALNVMSLSVLISIAFSGITLVACWLFNQQIAELLNKPEIARWLYLVPLSVFFVGVYQSLNFWINRRKKYKWLAQSKVYQSGTLAAGQLGLGAIGAGSGGLISGWVLGQFAAVCSLILRNWQNEKPFSRQVSLQKMIAQARRYQEFPKFSLPGAFVNSLSYNLVNLLIAIVFNATILGLYGIVFRVMGMPSAVIGNAVAQVYFQEAANEKRTTGAARKTFRKTLIKLTQVAVPLFIAIFFAVRYLFTPVFGEQWAEAGIYAQILLPFFFVRFISATLSTTMTVFEKLQQALYVHLSIVVVSVFSFSLSYFLQIDFRYFLVLYSVLLSCLYAIFLWYYYQLSLGETAKGEKA